MAVLKNNPDQTLEDLKKQVLRFLSSRPHSVAEVTKYLHSKTSAAALIDQTLEFLRKNRLVDDQSFARWLVESRSRSRPRGNRLLAGELKAKGIDPEIISDNRMTTDDEYELAKKALAKKLPPWSRLSAKDYRLKATRYLAARGFSWETIAKVVKAGYNDRHVI